MVKDFVVKILYHRSSKRSSLSDLNAYLFFSIYATGLSRLNATAPFSFIDIYELLCNNMLELAGNPSTAFTETDLSPAPKYNFENSLPDWISIIR